MRSSSRHGRAFPFVLRLLQKRIIAHLQKKIIAATNEYKNKKITKTKNRAGKEVRYPIILSRRQKDIAKKIVTAFEQTVCGFDLLVRYTYIYISSVCI